MRDSGFLLGEFKTSCPEKFGDEEFYLTFQQFFRSTGTTKSSAYRTMLTNASHARLLRTALGGFFRGHRGEVTEFRIIEAEQS
jgi:hypothetical protein